MTRGPDGNPEMTERHWEALERIQRQLQARRFNGQEFCKQVGPWERPECQDRSRRSVQ